MVALVLTIVGGLATIEGLVRVRVAEFVLHHWGSQGFETSLKGQYGHQMDLYL